MTYLDTDQAASVLARRWLRPLSDSDLAWFEFLSPSHLDLVCWLFNTVPEVLDAARRYETQRRKLFPREVLVKGERRLIQADGKMTTLGGMESPLSAHSHEGPRN